MLILAVAPAIDVVPASPGSIRAGGLPLAWWYAGLVAPLLGWGVAVWSIASERAVRESIAAAQPPATTTAPPSP